MVPSDPMVHCHGEVGISSRWWYLSGMFKPEFKCGSCHLDAAGEELVKAEAKAKPESGALGAFSARMRAKTAAKLASGGDARAAISTGELYCVPFASGDGLLSDDNEKYKSVRAQWPRYHCGRFEDGGRHGVSMWELDAEESSALQIVLLEVYAKPQKYGSPHHYNWKKIALSRAHFKKELVTRASMPTPRAAAAFDYLVAENKFYKRFLEKQKAAIDSGRPPPHWISTFDLFIGTTTPEPTPGRPDRLTPTNTWLGIECAMRPTLYPRTSFADTGLLQAWRQDSADDSVRIVSIGRSWTRKVCSGVRVYAEQSPLAFFLYEKQLANKYFAAHTRAQQRNLTADVMTRDSQSSAGYWEIVRDALADLVRIMLVRCFDQVNHRDLYNHVRGLRGQVWLCAFPNLFITIAPAEWKFPMPYFLEPYLNNVVAGAYLMALHMYYLVRCIWNFLAVRGGCKFFTVYEYVIKTEYQGRGTPHWHIAAWVVCYTYLRFLVGNSGKKIWSPFVKFLSMLFNAEIDVQVGNGRLNYINGYVAKDHDAVDVGLGEYVQTGSTAPWLATYRLLSKQTPCIPEVAIKMASLPEFERTYSHVLLYPPQPKDCTSPEDRRRNFSSRMYGFYLSAQEDQMKADQPIAQSFLVWHRAYVYDQDTQTCAERGGRHNQRHGKTLVVACRYWYELSDGFWGQFVLTQIPHINAADLLPQGKYLECMQNFFGVLEYLGSWSWAQEGVIKSDRGAQFRTSALPLCVDDDGDEEPVAKYAAGARVFPSADDCFEYLLRILSVSSPGYVSQMSDSPSYSSSPAPPSCVTCVA